MIPNLETAAPSSLAAWMVPGMALLVTLVLGLAGLLWLQRRQSRDLRRRLAREREAVSQMHADADPTLPGLVSRNRFDRLLQRAARQADPPRPMVVLFVNLDGFRSVNEGHGYRVADGALAEAASRLLSVVTAAGHRKPLVARLNVDEFLVLHPGDLDSACALARQLGQALAQPIALKWPATRRAESADSDLDAHAQPGTSRPSPDEGIADDAPRAVLGASIGLAAYPLHGSHLRLVAHAGAAMQAVKRAGGGDFMVFEPRMAIDQREQAELQADLRQAVARGELELFYQPKVDARTLQITAAEALLRWHHPRRGMVSPGVFIPIAERAGLIGEIGHWVIVDACRQAALWRDQGLRMRVAINLSAYQMRQHDLVDRIEAQLCQHRLRPERFTVEITESVAMEDTQVTQRSFERLRKAGLHVSIDDFGVGQASLSYLRRLPAAELKIDASFVREVHEREDARAIVDAVVKLAHALGLRVVAEGVELAAQRDELVRLGCDELQGFLFARPMSAKALGTWASLDAAQPRGEASFSPQLFQETQPSVDIA